MICVAPATPCCLSLHWGSRSPSVSSGTPWSLVAWIVPGSPGGDPWAWAWMTWWGCLLWLLWLIARWVGEDADAL